MHISQIPSTSCPAYHDDLWDIVSSCPTHTHTHALNPPYLVIHILFSSFNYLLSYLYHTLYPSFRSVLLCLFIYRLTDRVPHPKNVSFPLPLLPSPSLLCFIFLTLFLYRHHCCLLSCMIPLIYRRTVSVFSFIFFFFLSFIFFFLLFVVTAVVTDSSVLTLPLSTFPNFVLVQCSPFMAFPLAQS